MNLRRLLIATLVLLLLSPFAVSVASAQDGPTRFVESYNEVVGGHTNPSITFYAEGPVKGKFGWAGWVWAQRTEGENWAEGLVGLTYAPTESVQLALLVGAETDSRPARMAANFWVGKGRMTLESSYENGGSGYWHRHTGTIKLASWKVGANYTHLLGGGPYIEKTFGKWDMWVAPTRDGSHLGGSAGIRRNF